MAPKKKPAKKPDTAKLFWNGRSQAVRLPKEFRFEGTSVRVTRFGSGIFLEPAVKITKKKSRSVEDVMARLTELDAMRGDDLFPEGRQQNLAPIREYFE